MKLELVDEPCREVLVDDAGAAADDDVLSGRRVPRLVERGPDAVGHEGERRVREREWFPLVMGEDEDGHVERRLLAPPARQGPSPHGPGPPPNLPRPMTSAPTFASDSSTTGVLAFTSPPSIPCGSRNARSPNAQSCRPPPPYRRTARPQA